MISINFHSIEIENSWECFHTYVAIVLYLLDILGIVSFRSFNHVYFFFPRFNWNHFGLFTFLSGKYMRTYFALSEQNKT